MININILFPNERRRIKRKVEKEIKKQYNRGVRSFYFSHIGDEKITMYVFLKDGTPLYITMRIIGNMICDMTISEDMSF